MASSAEGCSPLGERMGSLVVSVTKYATKAKDVRDKLAQISQVMTARLANPPRRRRPSVSTRRRRGSRDISQDAVGQDLTLLHTLDALAAAAASASSIASDHGATIASDSGATIAADPGATIAADPGATIASDPGATIAADPGATIAADPGATIAADPGATIAADPGATIASPEPSLLSDVERSGSTWSTLVEDTIKAILSVMGVEALNKRMEMPCLPDEPPVEDLEERDALCFPSQDSVPADNRVIPASILDDLLDAPDEIAMSGVVEVDGVGNTLSRNDVDAARCLAFDAANDYLDRLRAAKARRLPSNGPTRRGRYLHRVEGFRFFRSIEEAVIDVTKAVMADDGGYGREATIPADSSSPKTKEDWVNPEEDDYFVTCKVTEDLLMELLGDTVEECKRVYNM